MRRILWSMIMVPIIIIVSFWGVNFASGVLSGEIDLAAWIVDHRMLFVFLACYFLIRFLNPFRQR